MSDDSLWEFDSIDVDEIHLVGMPANGVPQPLLAKSANERQGILAALDRIDPKKKGKQTMSKKSPLEKAIRAAISGDVSLAGTGSTSAGRLSRTVLDHMVDDAQGQTREISAIGGGRAVLKGFDDRVEKAQVRLAAAYDDYEIDRAKAELRDALKSRAAAKLILTENARARGQVPPGRYGPNSTDLFGGTSLTLPEDRQIHGI